MNSPGPTMKSIQKRFYTALPRAAAAASTSSPASPRVRSNSASRSLYTSANLPISFFDTPPPAPRPGHPHLLSTSKLPTDAVHADTADSPHSHGHSHTHGVPPFGLALTAPAAERSTSPGSSSAFLQSLAFTPITIPALHPPRADASAAERERPRYQFDAGGYGIPKRCRGHAHAQSVGGRAKEKGSLAVQVGEDAYFIRENAMGVADGVGGWARQARQQSVSPARSHSDPSPSARFASGLMHHCASEIAAASTSTPSSSRPPPTSPTFLPWPWSTPVSEQELQADLADELEELEEGLDVLRILERAYVKTLDAHVEAAEEPPPEPPEDAARMSTSLPSSFKLQPPPSPKAKEAPPEPKTVPIMAGASTALIAVLDARAGAPAIEVEEGEGADAVLRIAHLGDCMGMLVRGEEVVWRSKEMWLNFNTPYQLGPASRTRPSDAQVLTVPVRADDILILASDGLSDNLYDTEVLDEVVRFRRAFLGTGSSAQGLLGRRALAGMLSEALCSRARRVASEAEVDGEVPFARRAREAGKVFSGGKNDDISVIVAVISPTEGAECGRGS